MVETFARVEKSLYPVTANGGYMAQTVPSGTVLLKTQFQLPANVHCTNCVLRWHYFATNSCPPENHSQNPMQISEEFWNCADIRIDDVQGPDATTNTLPSEALMNALPLRQPQNLMGTGFNEYCPPEAIGEYGEFASVLQCYNPTGPECEYGGVAPSPKPTAAPTMPPTITTAEASTTDGATPPMNAECGNCVGCLHPGNNGWRACYTDWSPITCAMNAQYGYDACYPSEGIPVETERYTTSDDTSTGMPSSSPSTATTSSISSTYTVSSSEIIASSTTVSATPTIESTYMSILATESTPTTDIVSSPTETDTPKWSAGGNSKYLSCAESQCCGCLRIGYQCDGPTQGKEACDGWLDDGYLWCGI
ncbi:hypothetical protein SARC_10288 [Sphaeroforma arctica JP610]|uniref:Uncharacterized protein n=1 Tax=Sphaeroforma arctica JP610 TaxID=667725 RepID=A0A0L0FMI8_9EUKA|nr:hypothetical protein SARC_10288 [Sphaeroforma arctica JP610]KNC77248.1 hypothetical protein SARC_10288 [Sphaeroforma arctica JP610]|eukprot:XP_014151150.1 hypothetical protein SARC_10288 [Sphaeroforma arctica JP610]